MSLFTASYHKVFVKYETIGKIFNDKIGGYIGGG